MKEIFKVGDRVYHYTYGWGEVTSHEEDKIITVKFSDNTITFVDGRLLSFTEYTLQGFSQERPIVLPEVGELCLVRDEDTETWKVRSFLFESGGAFYIKARCGATDGYKQMKRIKILD